MMQGLAATKTRCSAAPLFLALPTPGISKHPSWTSTCPGPTWRHVHHSALALNNRQLLFDCLASTRGIVGITSPHLYDSHEQLRLLRTDLD